MKQLLSIVKITTNEIGVNVKIDFNRKTVSLVDDCFDHNNKEWMFISRGLEYKKGWHDILEAMKAAMDYGFHQLQKEKDELDKINEKRLKEVLKKRPNFGKLK